MAFYVAGDNIDDGDVTESSNGSADAAKGVKMTSQGYLHPTVMSKGGDGSDGALDTSGGTVDIDCSNAAVVVKNYTSINIVTNNLTFSNPHANGTIVILKAQGDFTCSATIDMSGMGAAGGAAGGISSAGSDGSTSNTNGGSTPETEGHGGGTGSNGSAGNGGTAHNTRALTSMVIGRALPLLTVGGGGGGGGGSIQAAGGAGGRGGGGLYIEVGDAYNFTGTITVAGDNGVNGSGGTQGSGGGGGGGGGFIVVLYGNLTADSGTYTVSGGTGGTKGGGAGTPNGGGGGGGGSMLNTGSNGSSSGSGGDGGAGATGFSLAAKMETMY